LQLSESGAEIGGLLSLSLRFVFRWFFRSSICLRHLSSSLNFWIRLFFVQLFLCCAGPVDGSVLLSRSCSSQPVLSAASAVLLRQVWCAARFQPSRRFVVCVCTFDAMRLLSDSPMQIQLPCWSSRRSSSTAQASFKNSRNYASRVGSPGDLRRRVILKAWSAVWWFLGSFLGSVCALRSVRSCWFPSSVHVSVPYRLSVRPFVRPSVLRPSVRFALCCHVLSCAVPVLSRRRSCCPVLSCPCPLPSVLSCNSLCRPSNSVLLHLHFNINSNLQLNFNFNINTTIFFSVSDLVSWRLRVVSWCRFGSSLLCSSASFRLQCLQCFIFQDSWMVYGWCILGGLENWRGVFAAHPLDHRFVFCCCEFLLVSIFCSTCIRLQLSVISSYRFIILHLFVVSVWNGLRFVGGGGRRRPFGFLVRVPSLSVRRQYVLSSVWVSCWWRVVE
jgi:hypothetical protein